VIVTDDGQGCGTVDPAAHGGIGHMHTRAALIGARLRIGQANRKSGGTRVVVEIDRQPARELAGAAAATAPAQLAVSEAM